MKFLLQLFILPVLFVSLAFAQSYSGPKTGSVPSGLLINTNNYSITTDLPEPGERGIRNTIKDYDFDSQHPLRLTKSKEGDNYFLDPSVELKNSVSSTVNSVLLNSFSGMAQTNSIPPDPYIAVGPNHIMTVVNSNFSIWDKEGNLVKEINATTWYRNMYVAARPFDPKVLYDHFEKRWIMVWLDQNDDLKYGTFFVSVSEDSIPTGNWYNWSLPSTLNGDSVVTNWGDYQGVGFDKDAIYISANQWSFGGSFQYVKIRILPKAQLYANSAGSVTWSDIWNIGYPSGGIAQNVFNIRPSIMYTENSDYYLLHAPNASIDYFVIYTISNPLTTPVLKAKFVPVSYYSPAPNANQLGGGTMLLETGGSHLRSEPKYRDGYLWAVHSIRNPSGGSSLRYVVIEAEAATAVEDVAMGAPNYWYSYPAIEVDKDYNVAITFSRSATTEYIGAYYTYRAASDAPGLRGSLTLQEGKASYQKDYSSGRNRWGDYNGIVIDPSDDYGMWMFTEYASAANTWGTWVGNIRLAPFEGIYPVLSDLVVDFGSAEINTVSDTITVIVSNWGENNFVIQNIPSEIGAFKFLNNISLPYSLSTYDTLKLRFSFNPVDTGAYSVIYPVITNDPSVNSITLEGYGFNIVAAENNKLYAVTGANNSNVSLLLNKQNGSGTLLGPSKINEIRGIAVDPLTKFIYGVNTNNDIVRYNSEKGDAYPLFETGLINLNAIAFDRSGKMYIAQRSGEIHLVDLENRTTTQISKSKIPLNDIAFNPVNNELWASLYPVTSSGRDRIFKLDLSTGDTTLIGQTGLGLAVPALTFDNNGTLYAVSGSATVVNDLIVIDLSTGTGTIIGSTGFRNITGLAHSFDGVTSARTENGQVPSEFGLLQNYPNPFNPSTVIEYSLPEVSNVRVAIYNLLGETIEILINSTIQAGIHRLEWNTSGKNVSSGIYFYEVKAKSSSGKDYSAIRKMILMK
jgi:hypothetical protein